MEKNPTTDRILARRQERVEDSLSLKEIFTLHSVALGEVTLEDRERNALIDRLSADPIAARKLRELLRFSHTHDNDVDSGEDQNLEEGVAGRWAAFQAALASGGLTAEATEVRKEARPLRQTADGRSRQAWPVAASFIVGAALMLLVSSQGARRPGKVSVSTPAANLPIVELTNDGTSLRRGAESIRLPKAADGLVVALTPKDLSDNSPFSLVVVDGDSERVLELPDLLPGPGGVFVLMLPRDLVSNGKYRLDLHESNGRRAATFVLEVAAAPDLAD